MLFHCKESSDKFKAMAFDVGVSHEIIKKISAFKEVYVTAWMAETGLLPSECQLVCKIDGSKFKIWIERKTE